MKKIVNVGLLPILSAIKPNKKYQIADATFIAINQSAVLNTVKPWVFANNLESGHNCVIT